MPGKSRSPGAKGKPRGRPFQPGDKRAGRPKGTQNKATIEVKEAARKLVEDPEYRENLATRLKLGEAAPAVEAMLWHYAYGKPVDKVEMTGPNGGPLSGAPSVVLYMPDNGRGPVVTPVEQPTAQEPGGGAKGSST